MAGLTNEDLMRLADGHVSGSEREEMLEKLAQDPSAQARLAAFAVAGGALAAPFAPIANAPVPRHLVELVLGNAALRHASHPAAASWYERFLAAVSPRWVPALATGLVLAGGVAGWLLNGTIDRREPLGSIAFADGRMQAQGVLARALETAASGQSVAAVAQREAAASVSLRLTFADKSGRYCRQYVLSLPNNAHYAGIGCREPDASWSVRYHVPTSPRPTADKKGVPASGDAAVAGVIEAMSATDPLGPDDEARLLAKRWIE